MADDESYKIILDELMEPAISQVGEDQFRKWQEGTKLMHETSIALSKNPVDEESFRQATDQFMWEEVPVKETQKIFANVFRNEPALKSKFASFLDVEINNETDEELAHAKLCDLMGTITMKKDPKAPELDEVTKWFQDVQNRFEKDPEKDKELLRTFVAASNEGLDHGIYREKIVGILNGEPDLLARYELLWSEKVENKTE